MALPTVITNPCSVNNVKDLYSLLKFLRITGGLEQSEIFNTLITRPLAEKSPQAEALLQNLMQDLCLRRKKDMKFVDLKLPPKTEYKHRITFRPDEKKKYEALLCVTLTGSWGVYLANGLAVPKPRVSWLNIRKILQMAKRVDFKVFWSAFFV